MFDKFDKGEIFVKPLSVEEVDDAIAFIEPHESECVNLTRELLRGAKDCYVLKHDEKLCGVFCFREKRSVFHCLPFTKYKTLADKALCQRAQSPLSVFFKEKNPFCINGEASGSVFLKNILKTKIPSLSARVVGEYFLMTKNSRALLKDNGKYWGSSVENLSPQFKLFVASPDDVDKLLLLEEAYQYEEVIPEKYSVPRTVLKSNFLKNIGEQKIYALEYAGEAVAKASISAFGKNFALIGGVYTKPEFRRHAFASILMHRIFDLLREKNIGATLFVRKINAGAVRLYKGLGFSKTADYRLIYF